MTATPESKHSPPPWVVGITYDRWDWPTFRLKDMRDPKDEAELQANARLIAYAPALLEALKNIVHLHACEQEGIESGRPTQKQWEVAVEAGAEALALAEGRG